MAQLHAPSLVERREDLPLLVAHFLRKNQVQFCRSRLQLTRRAEAMVQRYPWPGNVRELENALHYCAMMCEDEVIDIDHFPASITQHPGIQDPAQAQTEFVTLAEMERLYVQRVLDHVCGNRALAARILGVGRATIYRMLAR
jgi:DNA-binding NtrC family response regulator